MDPEHQELNRNPDGTFPPGVSGNPAGRPKQKTLKEYAREWYMLKTDGEKQAYLEAVEAKRPGFAWQMAEGSPHQSQDIEHKGNVTLQFHGSFNKQPHAGPTPEAGESHTEQR